MNFSNVLKALMSLFFIMATQIAYSATVVEFYNPDLDNYFITADPGEQAFVDGGTMGRWQRTGNTFASGGSNQVCRFYGSALGPNSHFYTADPQECSQLKSIYNPAAKSWKFESNDFSINLAVNGACAAGQTPVYRAYNNGFARGVDSNHRITTSLTDIQQVVAKGWSNEGIVMCSGSSSVTGVGSAIISPGAGGQSVNYPADGTAVSLKVTDAAGYIWQLDVAGKALELPTTITMTPLASVTGQGTPGPLAAGVRLEPDGLRFLTYATLTVTPPATVAKVIILTSNHDGTGLEFAKTTSSGSFSAPLYHFSAAIAADPAAAPQQWENAARTNYDTAEVAARNLLSQPIAAAPVPPSASLNCYGTSAYMNQEVAIKQFLDTVKNPEWAAIQQILGAQRNLSLLGVDSYGDGVNLAAQLADRVVKRVGGLVSAYKPQPDKFLPVARAVMEAESVAQLLSSSEYQSYIPELAAWAQQAAKQYLGDLRTKHDYTLIPAVVAMARMGILLGADDVSHSFLKEFENALTFSVEYDLTVSSTPDWNAHAYETATHTTFKATVLLDASGAAQWAASGDGQYVSGHSGGVPLISPSTFPVNVKIKSFDACVAKTVDLYIDRFSAVSERYSGWNIAGFIEFDIAGWGQTVMYMQEPYQNTPTPFIGGLNPVTIDAGFFKFSIPIQNLQVTAAQDRIKSLGSDASLVFSVDMPLQLVHTPK